MRHLCAVTRQDRAHPVAEEAGVDNQRLVAGCDQVGRGHVHRQRARPGDDERLPVGGEEDLAQAFQRLAERGDEIGGDVARGRRAQRSEHSRLEFDGAGDHEQGAILHESVRSCWTSCVRGAL